MQSTIQGLLSQYITNLEKTELSLWSGTLDLKNIILNEDAMEDLVGFSSYNLRLSSNFIDKVHIDIPIIDFLSKPMTIKANSLYATLNFISQDQLDLIKKRRREEDKKQDNQNLSQFNQALKVQDQEETILNSMRQKLTQNINIDLQKGKFILFSDQGFDLVLKIKNVHIVNNKNYYHDEFDPEYDQCNNNQVKQMFKKLMKFDSPLEIRLNIDVFKKMCFLWNLLTVKSLSADSQQQIQQQQSYIMPPNSQDQYANKYETDQDGQNLLYIGDIQNFKLNLYNFASIFKQTLSFGRVEFKYHSQEADNYLALLSLITSNLFTIEIQSFHEKYEYKLLSEEVIIRLFKIKESLKFIDETLKAFEDINAMNFKHKLSSITPDQQQQNLDSPSQNQNQIYQRPKINIDIKLFEVELIDAVDPSISKLTFAINGVSGFENKSTKKQHIVFGSINFKVFDCYLFKDIEMRYVFDERSQQINANRIPIEVDILQLNKLLKMNLMDDIDTFFKIITLIIQSPQEQKLERRRGSSFIESRQEIMPQENNQIDRSSKSKKKFVVIVTCNHINLAFGYRDQKNYQFNEILQLDIFHPHMRLKDQKMQIDFQLRSHIIERMTLQKINFIDKLNQNLRNLEAFIINPPSKLNDNSLKLPFLSFTQEYLLRFETQEYEFSSFKRFDFAFDLQQLFFKFYQHRYLSDQKYFFESLLDIDKKAQFILFINCSDEDYLDITILERYSLLNKITPGLKLKYGSNAESLEIDLAYNSNQEIDLMQTIDSISVSFQDIKQAQISLYSEMYHDLSSVIEDQTSHQLTMSYQVLKYPSQNFIETQNCELLALLPFISLHNGYKSLITGTISVQKPLESVHYRHTQTKLTKEIGIKVINNVVFSDKILTLRDNLVFQELKDVNCMCFIKTELQVKDQNSLIIISPAIKLYNYYERFLMLTQLGKEFQQLILNDKNVLYRFQIQKQLYQSEDPQKSFNQIPKSAEQMVQTLLNQIVIEIKMIESKNLERFLILKERLNFFIEEQIVDLVLEQIQTKNFNYHEKTSNSSHIIDSRDFISVEFEMSFNQDQSEFSLEIKQSQDRKQALEIQNNTQIFNLKFLPNNQSVSGFEIESSQSIQFSSEKNIKYRYQDGNWNQDIIIDSDLYNILQDKITFDLDPSQLVDKEKVIKVYNLKMISKYDGIEDQVAIKIEYIKLNNKLLTLKISQEESQAEFFAESEELNEQMLNYDIYDNIQAKPGKPIIQNQTSQINILQLDDGLSFQMITAPHNEDVTLVKLMEISFGSKIDINVDELFKILSLGFINQVQTNTIKVNGQSLQLNNNGQQASRKYLINSFKVSKIELSISLNFSQIANIQIDDALVLMQEIQKKNIGFKGEMIDYINIALEHLTTQVFYSLHRLLYHSNFMGKLPSIYNQAKRDISDSLQNSYRVLKFIYNIGSSFSSNLFKFTIGKGLSDQQNFLIYFEQKLQANQSSWFQHNLNNMSPQLVTAYFNHVHEERVFLYLDECFLDTSNKSSNCHLVILSHSIILIFETQNEMKLFQLNYNHIRKFQFLQEEQSDYNGVNEFVRLLIGLKKRAMNKINENVSFQILNSSLNLEVPRRQAEIMLSILRNMEIINKTINNNQ
ncbi:UNKNOWN [Stylonychia lemnae]|uniref:Uncharacterized protein n=1 Tax=Stylonychia lemnae TaxID=5949 RepID=A0A077ZT97_STYLE|nr:UNKNOWN [Stylonychia lemnae]|eukprot:CDW72550.1 UNKNOWN [Stylonychia lemnae]